MEINATLAWLLLLVNDERVLEVVRWISGCGPIGHFDGRVYRLDPSTDHYDSCATSARADRGQGASTREATVRGRSARDPRPSLGCRRHGQECSDR